MRAKVGFLECARIGNCLEAPPASSVFPSEQFHLHSPLSCIIVCCSCPAWFVPVVWRTSLAMRHADGADAIWPSRSTKPAVPTWSLVQLLRVLSRTSRTFMTCHIIWIGVRQTAVPRRGLWVRAPVDIDTRAVYEHSWRSVSDLVFTCAVAEEEDAALEAQAKKDEEEVEVDECVMRGKDLDRRTDLAVTDRRSGRPSGWDSSGACLCRLAVYPFWGTAIRKQ